MTIHFNITPLKKRRRYLRSHLPKAEVLLWMHLSNRQMLGYKFRRQYSVDRFVIDFYSPKLRLAIEVDGESHFTPVAMIYDRGRQHHIESFGIRFLRVMNEDVYHNLDAVLNEIAATIRTIEAGRKQPPLRCVLSFQEGICEKHPGKTTTADPIIDPPNLPSGFEGGGRRDH